MEIIKDIISKTKNDKLDPLSIIIKLFIYGYKPIGTKISIYNNKLYIQNSGIYQSTIRTLYGDSKNDINIMFFPILFACKYFLSNQYIEQLAELEQLSELVGLEQLSGSEQLAELDKQNNLSKNSKVIQLSDYSTNQNKFNGLFNKLLDSFDKLKETYQSNEIVYNIDQLKNIIQSFLSASELDINNLFITYNSPSGKIKQNIYKHISTVWTVKRLNVLFGHIDEIIELSTINAQSELIDNLINSLSTYMNYIDCLVCNIICKLN
jgi:hypothetical protein